MRQNILFRPIKKRYLIYFCIAGFLLGSLITIPLHSIVSGASVTYSFGFEDTTAGTQITEGLPSGSDNIFTSETATPTTFCTTSTYKNSGSRGFLMNYNAQVIGYFNATYENSLYMTSFSWYQLVGTNTQNFYFYFYNSSHPSDYIIKFITSSGLKMLQYYDDTDTGHNIGNFVAGSFIRCGFNITSSLGDVTYFCNGVSVDGVARTPLSITNNYRIDRIYIKINGQTAMISAWDDISYNLSGDYNTSSTDGDYMDLSDLNSYCSGTWGNYVSAVYTISNYNIFGQLTGSTMYPMKYVENEFIYPWSGTIKGVDLPISYEQYNSISSDVNDYDLYVNGIPWGSPDVIIPYGSDYALRWYQAIGTTLTNEKPLFSFSCSKTVTYGSDAFYWYGIGCNPSGSLSMTKGHNDIFFYVDEYLNGFTMAGGKLSMCFYFNETNGDYKPVVPPDVLNGYIDTFGEEFIQFYQYGTECFHGVNDNPYIIYNISDNYFDSTSSIYLFRIFKVGSLSFVYQGAITFTGDYQSAYYQIPDYTFPSVGQYYIVLYNTTEYGTTIGSVIGNMGNPSQAIYVCTVGTGDNGGDDTIPPNEVTADSIFIITGLFCVIGAGVAIAVVLQTPFGFLLGSIPTAYILSLSVLGDFQLLPQEVGYGLIVVLVLVGIIIWFLD